MNLKEIVWKHVKSADLPELSELSVTSEKQIFPAWGTEFRQRIKIDLTVDWGSYTKPNSHLRFWYNSNMNEIDNVSIQLEKKYLGQKYGRKLVNTMESIARDLSCEKIILGIIIDDKAASFWSHMGYSVNGKYGQKMLT